MALAKKKFRTSHRLILPEALADWTEFRPAPLPSEAPWPILEKKIPAEKLIAWRDLHYRWGRNLLEKLQNDFQIKGELLEVQLGQSPTGLDLLARSGNYLSAQVQLPDQADQVWLFLSENLAKFLAAETLGQGFADLTGSQPLTELDQVNLKVALERFWQAAPAWPDKRLQNPAQIGPVKKETAPALPRYLAAALRLRWAGSQPGWLEVLYPESLLLKLLPVLPEAAAPPRRRIKLSGKSLADLAVPVSVRLGSSSVTAGDLAKLRRGDVVLLEKSLTEPVEIVFGQDLVLTGGPGLSHDHLAVQVLAANSLTRLTTPPQIETAPLSEKKEVELMKGKQYFSAEKEDYLTEELEEEELEEEKESEAEEVEKEIPAEEEETEGEELEEEEEEEVEEEEDEYEEYEEDDEDEV